MFKYLARLWKFHWMLHKKHNKSMWKRESISASEIPIPWYTYGAIEFLSRINAKTIFEYGCGNSTLWWAKRCQELYVVEHAFDWFKKIIEACPPSVTGYLAEKSSVAYVNSIDLPEVKFDLIIIDGKDRTKCAAVAINYLTENGVIVLDNVERNADAKLILLEAEFTEIPFKGIGPTNEYEWTTSVFVKNLKLWNK